MINLPDVQSTASNSLSDCQAAASSFLTTINYTASNITGTTGINTTCLASGIVCPGQTINGVCVWQRKLSAVCRNASGVIKIRIQTNGLPPRCANVPSGSFVELNVDFEVNFNPDVSINSLNSNLSTMALLSQTLCTLTSAVTVPSASGFVNYGKTPLDTATGVSVDGVMIFTPDSANNIDPFFPPGGGQTSESVDTCLAHCQITGIYHYHIASGCQVNPPTGNISSCAGTSSCISNVATYPISSFSNYQTKTVLGVAKDGHVIYGPYLSSGTRVITGFDVCNGMFYDSIGNYAYFATSTYPYLVGCFGPGNYPSFAPNCTTNGVSSYNMSSYAISFLSNSATSSTNTTTTTTTTTSSTTTTTTTTTKTTTATSITTTTTSSTTRMHPIP
ncbi:unnamed protein product [Adineta steineri]|uniref:YHYH domain-containing protein n=1 Tax=Adineta steineri TaxID=433720 RepID=A0A814RBN7_9BILA|nr:unnamed protein product [Adineta steineri]CAF1449715.1 unnamed protein product [Adineta steineri]